MLLGAARIVVKQTLLVNSLFLSPDVPNSQVVLKQDFIKTIQESVPDISPRIVSVLFESIAESPIECHDAERELKKYEDTKQRIFHAFSFVLSSTLFARKIIFVYLFRGY